MADIETTQNHMVINSNNITPPSSPNQSSKLPCSVGQILAIALPIAALGLFTAIFVPIYVVSKKKDDRIIILRDNNNTSTSNQTVGNQTKEYDEFEENITSLINATLTPKDGYDNILIFLGGISDVANKYFDFFKSKSTFVPKGTKIYCLSGPPRSMQFMIDYYNYAEPVPGWFNVAANASLMPTEHDFTEAKVSLNYVLDEIDRIKNYENIDYKNIYLSGFSQGALMTNYILLNSRHQLGGYIAFSGYVFDHDFLENAIVYDMSSEQIAKLQSKKDYHILATHSFMDDAVFYQMAAESYRYYYGNYTDFQLLSFGALNHVLPDQPVHPKVKQWLKDSMGK